MYVAKPLSVPYGLPILDPYKIPYVTLIGPILFAGLELWQHAAVYLHSKLWGYLPMNLN